MAQLQSTSITGTLSATGIFTTVSSGTAINFSGQSDSFGYNATSGLGTYIKGTGSTYIYGGGAFWDGSATRTIWHSGNFNPGSYLPLSGGTLTGQLTITSARLLVETGGTNSYGIVSGYNNNNHLMTMRGAISGSTSSPTVTGAHQMTFVEYAEANDSSGWFFKSSSTGTYQEIARITRTGINWNGNQVWHSGNFNPGSYLPLSGGTMTGNIQFNANTLQFNNSGVRSWNMAVSGGNLSISSGDGSGSLLYNSRPIRDSFYRTFSGYSDYYSGGSSGWYRAAEITLTGNCSGAVLYGTLYDHRYDGADTYQIAIVARAECDFTSNNESHYINVGCTILGSTNYTNYRDKIRVVLSASSGGSRTYELQIFETPWNHDTWQLETTGWTIYTSPQAPRSGVGTPRVNYISNKSADNIRANTGVYSPHFYDSSNAAYYLDGNVSGGWRLGTPSGFLDFGPLNSGFCHFQTDRDRFYFNKRVEIDGELWRHNGSRFVEANGGTWGINISGNAATASRVVSGTSTLAGVTFANTMLATQTAGRVTNFDGNGSAPSVWWTNGSTAIGAIDAIGGGGLSFWSNNGSSWQQQVSMTHGTFNVLTTLQQGGNQVVHAGNIQSYALQPIYGNSGSFNIDSNAGQHATVRFSQGTWGGTNPNPGNWSHIFSVNGSTDNRTVQLYMGDIPGAIWWRMNQGGTQHPWERILTSNNFTSFAVPIRGATNWNDSTVLDDVIGLMAWKNYGNNHVIFDASQSTAPNGTSINNTNSQVAWTGSYPTLMGWNGSNTYGVRVDSARIADTLSNMNISQFTNNSGYVTGGPYLPLSGGTVSGTLSFGSQTRQMINLWGTQYGIGVQSSTTYFRSDSRFSWHRGGSHNDAENNPGGGTVAMTLDSSSNLTLTGDSILLSNGSFRWQHSGQWVYAGTSAGNYANNMGVAAQQYWSQGDYYFGTRGVWLSAYLNQAVQTGSSPTFANLTLTGQAYINNSSPTIYLQDSDHRSAMIHVNSNVFYVLRGTGTNSTGWGQVNGLWPLEINLDNNNATFGGFVSAPNGDFRAPIFYDSQDTYYYIDPNSTSRVVRMQPLNLGGANLQLRSSGDIPVASGSREAITFIDGSVVQAHVSTGNGCGGCCYNWWSSEEVIVDPEKDYEFHVWVRSTGNDNVYLGWFELDVNGNGITSNPYFHTGGINTGGTWVKLTAKLKNWRTPAYGGGDSYGTDRYANSSNMSNDYTGTVDGVMHSFTRRVWIRLGTCYGSVNGSKTYFYGAQIREAGYDDYQQNFVIPYYNGSSWGGKLRFGLNDWGFFGIGMYGAAGEFRMSSDSGNLNLRVDGWVRSETALESAGSLTVSGQANLNANTNFVGRHIEANTTWGNCGCTTLFLGWSTGKVIIGNNGTGAHDWANDRPANSIVSTVDHYFYNNIYAREDVVAYWSDARLKTNVKPIDNALDKINKIGGYFYIPSQLAVDLDATKDMSERVGVMAQEIEEVLPHVVKPAPFNSEYKTVQYEKLVPLLIQGIKEQQKQIEELKTKLDALT